MTGPVIPDEAVWAADVAMNDGPGGVQVYDREIRVILAAAMPALRAQIAGEIEAASLSFPTIADGDVASTPAHLLGTGMRIGAAVVRWVSS